MIWKGHVSFGLVNIPVALHPAVTREELDFTLLDKKDMSPIGYRKINKRTGEECRQPDHAGFEHPKGRYVIVSDEDLRRASPDARNGSTSSRSPIRKTSIPIYYEHPYYLAPTAKTRRATPSCARRSVEAAGSRSRPWWCGPDSTLATVSVHGSVLALILLRYASELRDPKALGLPSDNLKALGISEKELRIAEQLIRDMTEPWDPTKYQDEYRREVLAFIRERARRGDVEEAPARAQPKREKGEVIDLMELLKRSVRNAVTRQRANGAPSPELADRPDEMSETGWLIVACGRRHAAGRGMGIARARDPSPPPAAVRQRGEKCMTP